MSDDLKASLALEEAIAKAVEGAIVEWQLLYPEFERLRIRLAQLAFGISGLAQDYGIELPQSELSQIKLLLVQFRRGRHK